MGQDKDSLIREGKRKAKNQTSEAKAVTISHQQTECPDSL